MSACISRKKRMGTASQVSLLCLFLLLPLPVWSSVFVGWSNPHVPAPEELGFRDIVVPWNESATSLLANVKQGYRVYVQVSTQQAAVAADKAAKNGAAGLLVAVTHSEREPAQAMLASLRSSYPKLKILALTTEGKQPEMRGSMVIKRDAVLEVSSPTAQPWIDSNLSLVRIEQRAFPDQVPLYTFSWNASQSGEQRDRPQATDYVLAVAEAGALHADLLLQVDKGLQKALTEHDASAWKLWNQVRSAAKFKRDGEALESAANLAVMVDDLDTGDEVMNLLARHNIPFRVFVPADLEEMHSQLYDVITVFAKPDEHAAAQLADFASSGKTVVLADAHGSYPWQKGEPLRLNEHATSYSIGSGKVLELSEPVSDPETFAQDIHRLIGKQNSLISLWNGLTTIAVPYSEEDGKVKLLELINYAEEPVRVQVRVRGSFPSVRYESPGGTSCQSLSPVSHDGFTEFVIPALRIAGRVHLQ